MRVLAIIIAALSTTPVVAQEALSGPEFGALVTGQTVTYLAQDGITIGIEAYHPNGRVTWLVGEGRCQKGRWFAQGPQICFEYQDQDATHCTDISHDTGTVTIQHAGGVTWTSTQINTRPINCAMEFLGS